LSDTERRFGASNADRWYLLESRRNSEDGVVNAFDIVRRVRVLESESEAICSGPSLDGGLKSRCVIVHGGFDHDVRLVAFDTVISLDMKRAFDALTPRDIQQLEWLKVERAGSLSG
jgi:hypothetical protein